MSLHSSCCYGSCPSHGEAGAGCTQDPHSGLTTSMKSTRSFAIESCGESRSVEMICSVFSDNAQQSMSSRSEPREMRASGALRSGAKVLASNTSPPLQNRARGPMFKIGPVEDVHTVRRHPGVPAAPMEGRNQEGRSTNANAVKGASPMDLCTSESLDESDSESPRCVLESLPSPPPSPTRDQVSPAMSPKKSPYSAELRTHFAPFGPYSRETRTGSLRQRSKSYAVLPQDHQGELRRSKSYCAGPRPLPPLPPPVVLSVIDSYTPSVLEFVLALEVDEAQDERMAAMPEDLWTPDFSTPAPPRVATGRGTAELPSNKFLIRVNRSRQIASVPESDFYMPF